MSSINKLGVNIRSLRKAYGETQEQLGAFIGVEKTAISNYESGRREPDKDTLIAIANHYLVSLEELLDGDMTSINKIELNMDAIRDNIGVFFPIISSDKALENKDFKRAFDVHKNLYRQYQQDAVNELDSLDICFDGYMKAYEYDEIEAEAAANILSLWFFVMTCKRGVLMLDENSALSMYLFKNNIKLKKQIENRSISSEVLNQDYQEALVDSEEWKPELLSIIKRSEEWSDLADYYLALQYVFGLVENDQKMSVNKCIGAEMLNAFISVKNRYAIQFVKAFRASLRR